MAEGATLSVASSMLHPTVRLLAWGAGVVISQVLPFQLLVAACLFAMLLAIWRAPLRFFLLLRRTRWLIVSLLGLFALATPGLYVMPALGAFSPTEEGLRLGLEHTLRLLVVLAALALMLEQTGMEPLLAGLHGLLRPLEWFGFDRSRVAIRVMLVLRYIELAPPGRHWREWLDAGTTDAATGPLLLRQHPLAAFDFAVLAGLAVLVLAAIVIGP